MTQRTVVSGSNTLGGNIARPYAIQADNGNVWVANADRTAATYKFYYSTDKGTTWNDSGSNFYGSYIQNVCIFAIGSKVWAWYDDVYGPFNNFLLFADGTFNAGRTSITWNNFNTIYSGGSDYANALGMTVHAQGSGYKAHLVSTHRYYGDINYWRLDLNSSGAYVSTDTMSTSFSAGVEGTQSPTRIFHDTSTKDLFLVTMLNAGGGQYDWHFMKRAYSSATWPLGTDRTLASQINYNFQGDVAWDGDRIVIAMYDEGVVTHSPTLVERDKADTTTTVRNPPSGISGSMGSNTSIAITTTSSKDVLLTWTDVGTDPTDVYKNTFTRTGATWSGATLVRDTSPNTNLYQASFAPGTKYYFFQGQS